MKQQPIVTRTLYAFELNIGGAWTRTVYETGSRPQAEFTLKSFRRDLGKDAVRMFKVETVETEVSE